MQHLVMYKKRKSQRPNFQFYIVCLAARARFGYEPLRVQLIVYVSCTRSSLLYAHAQHLNFWNCKSADSRILEYHRTIKKHSSLPLFKWQQMKQIKARHLNIRSEKVLLSWYNVQKLKRSESQTFPRIDMSHNIIIIFKTRRLSHWSNFQKGPGKK